jgi:hypothetical protein
MLPPRSSADMSRVTARADPDHGTHRRLPDAEAYLYDVSLGGVVDVLDVPVPDSI